MKKFRILLLFALIFNGLLAYAGDIPLNGALYFRPPARGEEPKENKFLLHIHRASKVHESQHWRYAYHISSREYLDCSYYKYVDCSKLQFCRCWQCRNHGYNYQYEDTQWDFRGRSRDDL